MASITCCRSGLSLTRESNQVVVRSVGPRGRHAGRLPRRGSPQARPDARRQGENGTPRVARWLAEEARAPGPDQKEVDGTRRLLQHRALGLTVLDVNESRLLDLDLDIGRPNGLPRGDRSPADRAELSGVVRW